MNRTGRWPQTRRPPPRREACLPVCGELCIGSRRVGWHGACRGTRAQRIADGSLPGTGAGQAPRRNGGAHRGACAADCRHAPVADRCPARAVTTRGYTARPAKAAHAPPRYPRQRMVAGCRPWRPHTGGGIPVHATPTRSRRRPSRGAHGHLLPITMLDELERRKTCCGLRIYPCHMVPRWRGWLAGRGPADRPGARRALGAAYRGCPWWHGRASF